MKQLVKNYIFNATSKTITFSDFVTLALERILLVVDVTANTTIYQFNAPNLGGSVSANVLTLAYDTTSFAGNDKLQIFYDCATGDPVYDLPTVAGNVGDGVADSGNPLKVGGVYTSSDPTYINGERSNLRVDSLGRLLTSPAPLSNATDSVQVFGSSFGASAPTTGFLAGLAGTSGNLSAWNAVSNNGSDAISGGGTGAVGSYMFNGTNWDRFRSATSANGTTGIGVLAAGALGFDGTNYRRIATNASGQVTLDPASSISTTLSGTFTTNLTQISGASLALGQATMAASLPVTIASNQSALTITDSNTSGLLLMQGSTTAGQTGVLTQGAVSASPPTYTTAQTSPLSLTTNGALRVAGAAIAASTPTVAFPMGINGTSNNLAIWNSVNGNGTDNITGGGTGAIGSYLFNGSGWDRQRGVFNGVTGDTATITGTTTNGAAQTNYGARGAIITAILGTVGGASPTLVMQLQWSPDGGTTWLAYGSPTGAVSVATGNTVTIAIYPTNLSVAGATPSAFTLGSTGGVILNAPLPRSWRVAYTGGGTSPSIPLASVQVNYMV